jgi:ankyrin repeat protein
MPNSQPPDNVTRFFEACANGDVDALRGLLADDPSLSRVTDPKSHYAGWTGLHVAAQRGHVDAVRLLLDRGADPNAREGGDNTYPLHWAAAHEHLEVVRTLVDAGGDVHGTGDVHELDVIGWASFYHDPAEDPAQMKASRRNLVSFLVERGARHHIFSAMSVGDLDLIRAVVAQNPGALDRRMSRFEHAQTPLHFAVNRKRYDILDLLIELGADLEAEDMSGQTALAAAMLRADREAMNRLHAAGAKPPKTIGPADFAAGMAKMADSIKKGVPMIHVPDVAAALEWYVSIGFKELGRYADDGLVNWGMLSFGNAEVMLNMHGKRGKQDVSLWFYTTRIDQLYELLKARQLEAAQAAVAGEPGEHQGIEFIEDIYDPPYGGREFGIRDLNGYNLFFLQPAGV